MSILIRGAGLPKSCHNCPCTVELFEYYDNTHSCECNILQKDTTNYSTGRREDCPLVEVSTRHGDLIDAEEIRKKIYEEFKGCCGIDVTESEIIRDFNGIIDSCKVIVEKE